MLWFLLENDTETIFDDDIFIDKMTDIINKNIYISFYNEYLHDNNPEVIERKKELARKKVIVNIIIFQILNFV